MSLKKKVEIDLRSEVFYLPIAGIKKTNTSNFFRRMVSLSLTQKQIDQISTVLGILSGFAGVLTANHVFDPQVGALISQTAGVVVSILVGKIGVDTANKLRA